MRQFLGAGVPSWPGTSVQIAITTVRETQAQHGTQEFLRFWVSFQGKGSGPSWPGGARATSRKCCAASEGARGWWVNFQRISWNLTDHPVCATKEASRNSLTGADPSLLARRDADARLRRFAIWTAPPGQEGQAAHQEISRSIEERRRGGGSTSNKEFFVCAGSTTPPRLADASRYFLMSLGPPLLARRGNTRANKKLKT